MKILAEFWVKNPSSGLTSKSIEISEEDIKEILLKKIVEEHNPDLDDIELDRLSFVVDFQ